MRHRRTGQRRRVVSATEASHQLEPLPTRSRRTRAAVTNGKTNRNKPRRAPWAPKVRAASGKSQPQIESFWDERRAQDQSVV